MMGARPIPWGNYIKWESPYITSFLPKPTKMGFLSFFFFFVSRRRITVFCLFFSLKKKNLKKNRFNNKNQDLKNEY